MCKPNSPTPGPPSIRQGHVGWTRHQSPPHTGGPMGRDRVRLPGKGNTRKLYQETPDMCPDRKRPAPVIRPKPRPDATYSDDTPPWRGWDFFRGLAERWPILTHGPRWIVRLGDHHPTCRYRRTVRALTFGATP